MTNIKATKRALGSSVLALFLCFAMLLGTTFAWFTDSVTSANNIITAGNLDVELYWTTTPEDDNSWKQVHANTNVFEDVDLWEPGKTEVVYLKVVNEGTLALRYNMNVNIVSETGSVNMAGKDFKLSDYIMYGITKYTEEYDTADAAITAVNNGTVTATKLNAAYISGTETLEKGESATIAMVVYMPETVGNEANHKKGFAVPEIKLGINLFATQATVESDSFSNKYDAESVVSAVGDTGSRISENKDITLVGVNTPTETLTLPAGYTGKVTLVNSILGSVEAEKDLDLAVYGSVVVKAPVEGKSAITGETINISGDGNLTAVGNGKAAFGIGGMNTKSITIKNVTVQHVAGGCAGEVGPDTKYYKDAPEGGSAIGSGFDGAVITLENVVVKEAIGGSKAAGIGARYHVGVTVNIENSVIEYAEGGATAAGIGGSRVSKEATESGVTINITASTINAVGGVYAAGIGSGYDTHCGSNQPTCTINIADSNIIAQGGQYAAGVGTGYHNASLKGEIKNSTVDAKSGAKFYKDEYTQAQDIGFGVVDLTREGQQTDSKIVYNGKSITLKGELTVESAPIIGNSEVGKGEKYEGDIFDDEIKDALIVQNKDLTGGANIIVERTYDSVVLENVIADVKGNLITSKTENTIVLWDCDIKLDDGEKIVKIDGDIYTVQVVLHNVKVNGEILTSSTVEQYLEGVGTYTFY